MGRGRTVFRLLLFGALSALLVALGARLSKEILNRRGREGRVTAKDVERAQEVADAYDSEFIELDRTVLPGISIRS
jgi:cob(I)alamin adenosyltransferase